MAANDIWDRDHILANFQVGCKNVILIVVFCVFCKFLFYLIFASFIIMTSFIFFIYIGCHWK